MKNSENSLVEKKDIPSGSELMVMPGPEAELVLNALPFAAQLDCVLQVPWKERMDVIMQSHAARELIQALPLEEVFWMVKQRGVEDSLPVIARTTHEQFQYLIDLDCWQREQLVPDNLLAWFRVLARCNIAKVLEWFEQADTSLLVACLKQCVSIHKIEEESDFSEEYEAMPPCTLDGINFFRFATEEAQLVLFPLFKVLMNNAADYFKSLTEGIIWDSRIESEEDALHWRQSRAAENGFPFFDQALGIYQPLSDNEMKEQAPACAEEPGREGELRLRYALAEDRLPAFLRSCLPGLEADQLERFETILITTANKVIVADCMEVGDLDVVRRALHKTAGFISIGLEHLSSGKSAAAQALIASKHPEILFRCGFTLVNAIAERVRKYKGIIWTAHAPRFTSFYCSPFADTLLGLIRSRPLLYEGLIKPDSSLYRDFENLTEVAAAGSAVDRLIAADTLLFECAGLRLPELEQACFTHKAINDQAELTMPALLATMLIAQSLNADTRLPLLEARELSLFAEQIRHVAGSNIKKGLELFGDQALDWLEAEIIRGAIDRGTACMLVQDCLEPLTEMIETCTGPESELQYVSAVLLKRV